MDDSASHEYNWSNKKCYYRNNKKISGV